MTATVRKLLERLRESYWFLPSVMALIALLLAGGMVWLDSRVGSEWMDRVSWLYAARPDGARSLLSSIGGSMVTVAGTVFSVTIAAVVYASGQYGPRLLSNFMEDRGNQVTLGTFLATFLYCMVVLRTIRSPDDSAHAAAFVPQLALLVAVALMIASIAVLIFFVHHVPTRIHINNVVERIGAMLLEDIDERFPHSVGQALDASGDPASLVPVALRTSSAHGCPITAGETGYVQLVDEQALLDAAAAHDLVLAVRSRPGAFVHASDPLAIASASDLGDEARRAVRRAFAIGARRSPTQDLAFLIDELVEIAARALSPGVNDPFTAMTCLDWLGAGFADLATRRPPSHLRAGSDGTLRVIARPMVFAELASEAFGRLLPYAATDANAAVRFLHTLQRVASHCKDEERRQMLRRIGDDLMTVVREELDGAPLAVVEEAQRELQAGAA